MRQLVLTVCLALSAARLSQAVDFVGKSDSPHTGSHTDVNEIWKRRSSLCPEQAMTADGNQNLTSLSHLPVNSQPWPAIKSNTGQSKIIPVLVGGTALTFTPNSVIANPGDVIQFQFAARNHTVTQSLPNTPCRPVEGAAGVAPGVNSGFIPFDGGASGMVGTFNVPVMSASPMFLYCAQAMHCQQGMVMTVNA